MILVHLLFQLLQVIAHNPRFVIFDFLTLWNEAWGPLAQIAHLMQEAMWNPNFGFPLAVTETPSSEILVAALAEHTGESWTYWGQCHNYLFVHNFTLGGNITYLKGLRVLNRQHGQLNLGKGTVKFSKLSFGLQVRWNLQRLWPWVMRNQFLHRPPFSLSIEAVSLQKQEMTLFLFVVVSGYSVICTSLQK